MSFMSVNKICFLSVAVCNFQAAVHDPGEHPTIEENGFLVPPGRLALATLSKTTV